MSLRQRERKRLSIYELKAVSHHNDSVPDCDTTPDEAQQKQGIVELAVARFWRNDLL